MGQVRVVIEYEPNDSPPRLGDVCIFANVYPEIEKELYPIPLYTVRTNRLFRHSSGSITSKQFIVEECVGNHVVLSYQTPENWHVTFEIHRYNLLITHRYCGTVEKVEESLLDFCDNIAQSPMVEVLSRP